MRITLFGKGRAIVHETDSDLAGGSHPLRVVLWGERVFVLLSYTFDGALYEEVPAPLRLPEGA